MASTTVAASTDAPPFTAGVEDDIRLTRHTDFAANCLCRVTRRVVAAKCALQHQRLSQEALATHGGSGGALHTSAPSAPAVSSSLTAPSVSEENLCRVFREAYDTLWSERSWVRETGRREWLEVALTLLADLDADEEAFRWLLDHPTAAKADAVRSHSESGQRGASEALSAVSTPAKAKKMWVLWEQPQRHVHFMTLRTEAVLPAKPAPYAVREAMRVSDIVHMDAAAFHARVRVWMRCTRLTEALTAHGEEGQGADEAELRALLQSALPHAVHHSMVVGAIRYRMMVELCAIRLARTPRCTLTWRCWVDALRSLVAERARERLVAELPSVKEEEEEEEERMGAAAAALVTAIEEYTSNFIIPYLELRDRLAEATRRAIPRVRPLLRECAGSGVWSAIDSLRQRKTNPSSEGGSSPAEQLLAAIHALCGFADTRPVSHEAEQALRGVLRFSEQDNDVVDGAAGSCAAVSEADPNGAAPTPKDSETESARLWSCAGERHRRMVQFLDRYLCHGPATAFDLGGGGSSAGGGGGGKAS